MKAVATVSPPTAVQKSDGLLSITSRHKASANSVSAILNGESYFGQQVVVHRKGATLAERSVVGIIPGSQGTASYIVDGLGNLDSFNSCSHGAGRVMSPPKR